MSSSVDPSVRPTHGEATPAVPPWLQARLDELVGRATAARAALATGEAWRESLAALAATEDLADDLQHAVVDELRARTPKAWSWSAQWLEWSGVMANLTPAALSGQAAVHPTREAAAVQVIESWQQTRSRGASRRRR
jgi:hypothetical protein